MAKLIFISPYLKGGTNSARLANHVRYISTRDGVQILDDGAKNLPPTKKQLDKKAPQRIAGVEDRARSSRGRPRRSCKLSHTIILGVTYLNKSKYTNYNDLPLMLSVSDVASVLGISRAGAYELVRSDGFPSLRIGSRIVVPKEKFIEWINANTRA